MVPTFSTLLKHVTGELMTSLLGRKEHENVVGPVSVYPSHIISNVTSEVSQEPDTKNYSGDKEKWRITHMSPGSVQYTDIYRMLKSEV